MWRFRFSSNLQSKCEIDIFFSNCKIWTFEMFPIQVSVEEFNVLLSPKYAAPNKLLHPEWPKLHWVFGSVKFTHSREKLNEGNHLWWSGDWKKKIPYFIVVFNSYCPACMLTVTATILLFFFYLYSTARLNSRLKDGKKSPNFLADSKQKQSKISEEIRRNQSLNRVIQEAPAFLQNAHFNMTSSTPVLLLTYMRSGSTWLGSITNRAPGAWYLWEPLFHLIDEGYITNGFVCMNNDVCR